MGQAWASPTLAWLQYAPACVCLFGLTTYHRSLWLLFCMCASCVNSKTTRELKARTMCGLYLLVGDNKDRDHSWTYLFSGSSDRGKRMTIFRCHLFCCLTHRSHWTWISSDIGTMLLATMQWRLLVVHAKKGD